MIIHTRRFRFSLYLFRLFVLVSFLLVIASVAFSDDSLRVHRVGRWAPNLPMHPATDIAILDSVAYVPHNGAGVRLLDARLLPQESEFTRLSLPAPANEVAIDGNRLYVAHDSGLTIFDITNRTSPAQLGFYPFGGAAKVEVSGDYAYLCNYYTVPTTMPFSWDALWSIRVLNVSNPVNPQVLTTINGEGIFKIAAVGRNIISNGGGSAGWEPYRYLQISTWDSATQAMLSTFTTGGEWPVGFYTTSDRCYFIDMNNLPSWRCYSFTSDTLLNGTDSVLSFDQSDFETVGGYLVASDGQSLQSYDNSNPLFPIPTATTPFSLQLDSPFRKTGNRLFTSTYGLREITVSSVGQINASQPFCATAYQQYTLSCYDSIGYQSLGSGGVAMLSLPASGVPQTERYFATNDAVRQVVQRDDYVYVLGNTLRTYQLTGGVPVLTDSIRPTTHMNGIAKLDTFLLVSSSDSGLFAFSLRNPAHPASPQRLTTYPSFNVVSDSTNFVVAVNTPTNHLLFGQLNRSQQTFATTLSPFSSNLYAIHGNVCCFAGVYDTVYYCDIQSETMLSSVRLQGPPQGLAMSGRNLFTANQLFNWVQVFYLPNSGTPIQIGYNENGQNLGTPIGIVVSGSQFYVPYSDRIDVFDCSDALSVPEPINMNGMPHEYTLNTFPNPFNSTTQIKFDLPRAGLVQVCVYDALGRLVRLLSDDQYRAGSYQLQWNGEDGDGRKVGSGVYFISLKSPTFVTTKKALLLK